MTSPVDKQHVDAVVTQLFREADTLVSTYAPHLGAAADVYVPLIRLGLAQLARFVTKLEYRDAAKKLDDMLASPLEKV